MVSLTHVLILMVIICGVFSYSHVPPLVIRNTGYYGDEESKCADALTDALLTLKDISNVYLILSTGKYLDNWGAYGSCIDSVETGAYWMTTVTGIPRDTEGKSNITFYTGLCVPKDCTEEDMTGLNELFLGAATFSNVTEPYISYFAVTEYVNEQQGAPKAGEVVMWLIILSFMGCMGVGTIIHLTKLCDRPHIKVKKNGVAVGENTQENYDAIQNEGEVDPNQVSKEFNNDIATLYRKKSFVTPLIAFSVLRNAPKLVTSQKNSQIHPQAITQDETTLQVMGGMRFYAMLWIVYANTYAFTEKSVVENIRNKPKFFDNFLFTIFPTAYFAADVFFFMSGFLAIYSILKLNNLTPLKVLTQYARRLYRLIPIIAFVMFTARFVIPRFIEGPLCQRYNEEFAHCDKYFWTNLLLINNFYPTGLGSTCMAWTWFASVDFQMFLLVPLIAVIFQKSKMAGYATTLALVGLGMLLTAILNGVADQTGANPYLDTAFFTDLYIKPWARAVPYFIGVYMGSLFYFYIKSTDEIFAFNKIKYNPIIRAAMYAVGFVLMFTTIFVLFDYTKNYGMNWSAGAQVIYSTLAPLTFILGVICWILPALLGRAKLIRFLLTGPILTLFGRVTYMVALAHPVLQIAIYVCVGQQIYIEGYKMFSIFVGHAFLIYLVSTSLNLLIELPIRGLESIWHDRFYALNIVDNWLSTETFEKMTSDKIGKAEEAKAID